LSVAELPANREDDAKVELLDIDTDWMNKTLDYFLALRRHDSMPMPRFYYHNGNTWTSVRRDDEFRQFWGLFGTGIVQPLRRRRTCVVKAHIWLWFSDGDTPPASPLPVSTEQQADSTFGMHCVAADQH
jgi:hypothetical protein